MTCALNIHGEVCAIYKAGGVPVEASSVLECIKIGSVKVNEITQLIQTNLDKDAEQRRFAFCLNFKIKIFFLLY